MCGAIQESNDMQRRCSAPTQLVSERTGLSHHTRRGEQGKRVRDVDFGGRICSSHDGQGHLRTDSPSRKLHSYAALRL